MPPPQSISIREGLSLGAIPTRGRLILTRAILHSARSPLQRLQHHSPENQLRSGDPISAHNSDSVRIDLKTVDNQGNM
jgi:hypothetical protein